MVEPFSLTNDGTEKELNSIYCFKPSSFFIWFRSLSVHIVLHFNASMFLPLARIRVRAEENSPGFHCSNEFSQW